MKKSKRILAAFIAFIMAFGIVPWIDVLQVHAAVQTPVDSLRVVQSIKTSNPDEYQFTFSWNRPVMGQTVDDLDITNGGVIALDYELVQKDATNGREYTYSSNQMNLSNLQGNTLNFTLTATLNGGSLYSYKVLPFHYHISGNSYSTVYPSGRAGKEIVFLTDISVEATGAGKSLTVTWDNPSFNGGNFFTGYRIYYARGGSSVKFPEADNPSGAVSVAVGNPDLKLDSSGRWTYTFPADVEPGYLYAVKVEPLIKGSNVDGMLVGGVLARKATEIVYNNTTYEFHSNSSVEYRTNNASVKLALNLRETMKDKLLLYWDAVSLGTAGGTIKTLEIIFSENKDLSDAKTVGTLYYPAAATILEFMVERPASKGYYYYVITYEMPDPNYPDDPTKTIEGYWESEVVEYDRSAVPFVPNKPLIKEVTTVPEVLDNVELESLTIVWEAFYRKPVTEEEELEATKDLYGKIIDRNVFYDIWVTDDLANLDNDAFQPTYRNISGASLTEHEYPFDAELGVATMPVYLYTITEYASMVNGVYTVQSITDNKVYYFKVRVTRTNSLANESASAYSSIYVGLSGNISVNPYMISKPPLRIKTVNGVEQITTNTITIAWDTKWTEGYNNDDKTWYTEIGVGSDGTLVFGKAITDDMRTNAKVITLSQDVYADFSRVKSDLLALGASQDSVDLLPLRIIDITDAEARIHVVQKSVIDTAGGYEAYVAQLLAQDGDQTAVDNIWKAIKPEGDDPANHPEYTITEAYSPDGPLVANTQYVVIFRPFIKLGDGSLKAYYPSYVMGTTLVVMPPIEITPTVPNIIGVTQTDVTVTVKWEYKEGYQYELSYAELISQYDSAGIVISGNDVIKGGVLKTENGITYMQFTVTGLFPSTVYYFWVRAVTNNGVSIVYSEWSNPIMMKTVDILPPNPPQGLGLASEESLDIINKQMELEPAYMPIDYNYMIIEWLRDPHDYAASDEQTGNNAGESTTEILSSPDITATLIAKFNGLTANKTYYVRAKTRLVVTKGAAGTVSSYSYTVQISLSPDFTDVIEIIVPIDTTTGGQQSSQSLSKESDWSVTVHFITSPYKGEYDGDKNNSMYPLPDKDFEIVYNSQTDTLVLRFRSNGTDENGNKDNYADQRFISKLISDKTYNYIIDVTSYEGKAVANKVIQLPQSIIDAFNDRQISLTVRSGDMTVTFQPGFTKTAAVNALDKGSESSVKISLLSNFTSPSLEKRESYITKPQRLEIVYTTPKSDVAITNTAIPVSVSLKMQNRYAAIDSNTGGYLYQQTGDNDWLRQTSVYDNVSGQINFATARVGAYSAIAISAPEQTSFDNAALQSMRTISSLMNIQDINYYFPDAQTSSSQLNKLLAALAKGSKDVSINETLTEAEKTSLTKAGMLISGDKTVTREEAINSIVELYERKLKAQVNSYPSLSNTPYSDIKTASEAYQKALLKASELGMLDETGTNLARPKDMITLTETLQMLDIIILDAGL